MGCRAVNVALLPIDVAAHDDPTLLVHSFGYLVLHSVCEHVLSEQLATTNEPTFFRALPHRQEHVPAADVLVTATTATRTQHNNRIGRMVKCRSGALTQRVEQDLWPDRR